MIVTSKKQFRRKKHLPRAAEVALGAPQQRLLNNELAIALVV
jgi:hypothetical protein